MPSSLKHTNKSTPHRFPEVVERGPTGLKGSSKIYFTPVRVKGEQYGSYTVAYYNLGKRVRERFSSYPKAKAYAEEKAIQLSGGEMAAVGLKNEDQRIYGGAIEKLKPHNVELDFAVREYAQARELLGEVSVLDAVKFYRLHGLTVTQKGTTTEILQAMLQNLKVDGRSEYHQRDIKRYINAFIAKHSSQIEDVTSTDINKWLRSLEVGPRTRNNYRDSVQNFFHFAREEGYLPKDRPTAADATKRIKCASGENAVFTVSEITLMLKDAPEWLLPSLALKFFSGLRTEELMRINWADIKFDQDVILLVQRITKTKQRRIVPLLPNLKLWLEPYRAETGLIAQRWASAESLTKSWSRRAKQVGVVYKKNGMRNSYISYRLASIKNVAQVALEAGNSPRVIQKEYLELVTEAEAQKWFAVSPITISHA
ncbi:MAG: hypothetical protein B9S32_03835 [Verrucomicrobia bacterium Tous-C9LFEB]|nr:MAG: hypothetical protein B9S32_03835 [Verrucomicrobia bacterium Tous-C9LFEB]